MAAHDVSRHDALIGCAIGGGRYRLERLLGVGASGRVYLAQQTNLDRLVAVKVLRRELEGGWQAERFRAEAMLASRLNHPNIAAILDCSTRDDEIPFIVMEYVAGQSLSRLIRNQAPLELSRVFLLISQILDGLEDAHEAGVIHADLKSPNIVITHTRTGVEQPKLVDFGIAVSTRQRRERDGTLYGTPEYLAPEVIRGQTPTESADIYGAGIILYELVAGSPPFVGRSLEETLRQQLDAPVPHLETRGNPTLDRLDSIVLRALAKDPRKRFRNVNEFRAALIATSLNAGAERLELMTIRPRRSRQPSTALMPTVEAKLPAVGAIRERLAVEIRRGDAREVTSRYLELGAALIRCGRQQAAVAELEEAAGVIAALERGDEVVWRLHLALAAARAESGDFEGALTGALRCLNTCQRSGVIEGCLSAHEMLARLYTAIGQPKSAIRHRETVHILQRRARPQCHAPNP